jgi:hypothetical protein
MVDDLGYSAMNMVLQELMGAAFGHAPKGLPQPARSRRAKLWELPARWHCPLVGTCLTLEDLRRIARQTGIDVAEMAEYALHAVIVSHCAERSAVAERVQRLLEARYAAALALFARAADDAALLALWREALVTGEVAGALWAAWSHAELSESVGATIYGEIHMASHQSGAAVRVDQRRFEQLKREHAALRDELEALRHGQSVTQREHERTVNDLRRQLADAGQRAALLGVRELELAGARKAVREHATLLERAEILAQRVETLEERNAHHARRCEQLAQTLNETQDELAAADAALESLLGVDAAPAAQPACPAAGVACMDCPAEVRLSGRCVLCIGGRANLVDGYRRLVENQGGRFLHHDGGLEESLHRIDAAVASADAVVCQAGCVSHAAYWRLKEACKKLGKPCVFLKSPGVTSFARGLASLAGREGALPH